MFKFVLPIISFYWFLHFVFHPPGLFHFYSLFIGVLVENNEVKKNKSPLNSLKSQNIAIQDKKSK